MATRKLEIVIAGDAKSAVAAFNRTEGATKSLDGGLDRTSKGLGKVSGAIGFAAKAAGGLGVAMLAKNLVSDAWEGLNRSEAATAQLQAGLVSTGNAANTTVTGMSSYADALELTTGKEAELIMEGQALLQTFTNVRNEAGLGNDVFNRATEAALDLSAKGFGSVTDASKMLGKALNDPVAGLNAMSRAGVTFSDEQKKLITRLVETGDTLGAQKLILDEVEKQVGGAAAAYGETLPGKIERGNAAVGRITETLLASAAPALESVATGVVSLATDLGLLDSVDIDLPDKLLELNEASVRLLPNWDAVSMRLRDTDMWNFGFGVGEGTKAVSELDYALAQLVSNGNPETAARQFEQLKAEVLAGGGTMEDVYSFFPQYTQASKELEASTTKTGDAQRDAAIDTQIWASEMQGLDEEVKGLTTSFDYLLGRFLSAEQQEINTREAQRRLTEAVREGIRENETAAAFNDRVSSSLINLVGELNAEYQQLVLAGDATGTVAERNRFLNDKLNILMGTFPSLAGEIRGYRDRLNEVPGDATTRFSTPGLDAGRTSARNFKGELEAIPNDIYVTVHPTLGKIDLRPLERINILGGRGFADGGIHESHVAQIANAGDWRVWAEPETGGEAYLPLARSKRAQTLPIWEEAGRRLGVEGFAAGGIADWSWRTAVGLKADERPVIAQVGDGLVSARGGGSGGRNTIVNVHVGTWLGNEAGIRDLARRINKVLTERGRLSGGSPT